jgi:hypothetical protein
MWVEVADQAADPLRCPKSGERLPDSDLDDTTELSDLDDPDATQEMP